MTEREENWKDIKDYKGIYQISNLGNVKNIQTNKYLSVETTIKKYCRVQLWKNGEGKHYRVHRLVWEAFNGEIPEGMQVNHINERKNDNRLENLNLMDCKSNNNWGTRNKRVSEKMTNGKLSKPVLQFDLDDNFIKEWPSAKEVERQLGFFATAIGACCLNKLHNKSAYNYKWKYKEVG